MILALLSLGVISRPTDLVFVRHAETQANATGIYNARTLNAFSKKGTAQVQDLTELLIVGQPFDRILVSPSPRAMRTILPYLKATKQVATVWPLLYECCTSKRPANAHAVSFKWTFGKLQIPADCKGYFRLLPTEESLPAVATYNEGLGQVVASVKEFKVKFAGERILLVGHSGHGGQFLHALTGKWKKVENAKLMTFALP